MADDDWPTTWRLLPDAQPCGRPKRNGEPCGAHRMRLPVPAPRDYISPACSSHATDAERALNEAVHARAEAAVDESQAAMPVACHSWAVTEDDRAAANALTVRADQVRFLWSWQLRRCAVCGAPGAQVEDHDHDTGLTRGFLCRSCNTQEPHGAPRFLKYRAKNPAGILGMVIKYVGMFAETDADRAYIPPPVEQSGAFVLATRYGQRHEDDHRSK